VYVAAQVVREVGLYVGAVIECDVTDDRSGRRPFGRHVRLLLG